MHVQKNIKLLVNLSYILVAETQFKIRSMQEYILPAVRNSLFGTFAAVLHIWRPSAISETWRQDVLWWRYDSYFKI
jgi:hypothetical protein